ncbi:MAG TPA: hypothetical protein PLV19_04500 [Nitrosomonas sp.]|nr:hypothetical protein [Nitrosomonas sp.]HQX13411.1 hypothetical protein [Nitrosomonas sp.]HRB21260.1 hypothetical protein [Nitrosomonas sp.]HRB31678.1 hypothetical protein [Nitrosomonas sp.]HRB44482.1 hypothetical protein [Nitrosomonas sp.]
MSPTYFRGLVLTSLVLTIAAATIDWLFPSLISQALTDAMQNEPPTEFIENQPFLALAVFLPWLLAAVASTIGLLFFKRWARVVALYSTLIGFAFYPFFGATVSSAFASALSEASFLVWGAVLALAYFSPISERFAVGGTHS